MPLRPRKLCSLATSGLAEAGLDEADAPQDEGAHDFLAQRGIGDDE